MSFPPGVQTCTATLGTAISYQGTPASISGTITADRTVIHQATGTRVCPVPEPLEAAAGGFLSTTLPVVDQSGFVGPDGQAVTFWYYTLTAVVQIGSTRLPVITKQFQLRSTDGGNVDLDLVPDGPVIPGVTAPVPLVLSVSNRTGVVTTQQIFDDLAPLLSNTFAPNAVADVPASVPVRNYSRTRRALQRVNGGQGRARVLLVGDSTTMGVGATPTAKGVSSYPYALMTGINKYLGPASYALGIPQQASFNDGRWQTSTDWAFNGTGLALGFGAFAHYDYTNPGTSAGRLRYTPDGTFDTFEVYYAISSANQTAFRVSYGAAGATSGWTDLAPINSTTGPATGGTTSGGNPAGWGKKVYTLPRGTHTIAFGGDPGDAGVAANMFVFGALAYDSTIPAIDVCNAGVGSSTTGGWTDVGFISGVYNGVQGIRTIAPDLTVIMLGINDGNAGVTAATYQANLTTLVTAAQETGDVILMSMVPSGTSRPSHAHEPDYLAAVKAVAAATGCGWVDITTRQDSYTANNGKGWAADDIGHLTATGYADVAKALELSLRAVS